MKYLLVYVKLICNDLYLLVCWVWWVLIGGIFCGVVFSVGILWCIVFSGGWGWI